MGSNPTPHYKQQLKTMNNKTKNYLRAIAKLLDEYSDVISNGGCDDMEVAEYIDKENLNIFIKEFNEYEMEMTFGWSEEDASSVKDKYIYGPGFIDFLSQKIKDTIKNEA